MVSNYKINYNVDLVFCIDVTGSMDTIIEIVQYNALNLYQDIKTCMEQKGKHIDELRVRIVYIVFPLIENYILCLTKALLEISK